MRNGVEEVAVERVKIGISLQCLCSTLVAGYLQGKGKKYVRQNRVTSASCITRPWPSDSDLHAGTSITRICVAIPPSITYL